MEGWLSEQEHWPRESVTLAIEPVRSTRAAEDGIYFIAKEDALRQTVRFFSFAARRITQLLAVDKQLLWWLGRLLYLWSDS